MKRRSTRTVTVFSFTSLTTTPCMTRLGMILRFQSLGLGRWFRGTPALGQQCRNPGDVLAHLADPRGVLELSAGTLEAQVELLLAQAGELAGKLVVGLGAQIRDLHDLTLLRPGGPPPWS